MSMPNIPDITPEIDLNREEALTLLLASIALEEMGLAHILNAEAEKLQHVLQDKEACLHDILAINDSVDRVIRSVSKLQILLQEKLEIAARFLERPEPCPHPRPPRPKPKCVLVGSGVTATENRNDRFFGAAVTLNASDVRQTKAERYPITYTLYKRGQGTSLSAQIVPLWRGLKIKCGELTHCPTPENPYILSMQGSAIMHLQGESEEGSQATVQFNLQVWDYGIRRSIHMRTWGEDEIFTHDSGIMAVAQGNLRIEPACKKS